MYGYLLLSSTLLMHTLPTASHPAASYPVAAGDKQFGVVLDAGSSSTKIRIYSWDKDPGRVPVIQEVLKPIKVRPGIASFKDNLQEINEYLATILKTIQEELSGDKWPSTPVFFMATAGLRLLPENVTRAIMQVVRGVLSDPDANPFRFEPQFATILAGEEEALFAWVTINYLKGFFDVKSSATESFGLVELGGGSAQIAFIPDDPIYEGKMPLIVGGQEYSVYCHSHLSYGATQITRRISEHLIKENPNANVIVNPCMLKDDARNDTFGDRTVSMVGGGNSSLCEQILRHYLRPAQPDMCSPKPCSIGQAYQPQIRDRKFFTSGLVYYLTKALGVVSGPGTLDLVFLQSTAREYCSKSLDDVVSVLGISSKWASRNCQDALYIPLLFNALGFDINTQNIFIGNDINGASIAWSLGGLLYEEERSKYADISGRGTFSK